jgi:hypothetical protein
MHWSGDCRSCHVCWLLSPHLCAAGCTLIPVIFCTCGACGFHAAVRAKVCALVVCGSCAQQVQKPSQSPVCVCGGGVVDAVLCLSCCIQRQLVKRACCAPTRVLPGLLCCRLVLSLSWTHSMVVSWQLLPLLASETCHCLAACINSPGGTHAAACGKYMRGKTAPALYHSDQVCCFCADQVVMPCI